MKHCYPTALLALATASGLQAQDFRPFRAGLTYQYSEATTPGDTTHTLRLLAGTRTGADSVFRFNASARRLARNPAMCYASHQQRPDNLFGATLTVKATGTEYVLTAANGRRCTLRPRQTLGQPWAAIAPGITAQVTARAVAPVFGQPDSVVTISFSNGASLRLSKRFGLLESPALLAYLDGRYPLRQLRAPAAPTRGQVFGPQAIHDYQPGDVFLRYSSYQPEGGTLCRESWQRDSILTRALSRTGDTILYTLQTRTLQRSYGVIGAPNGFCNTPAGVTFAPASISTLAVPRTSSQPEHALATNEFMAVPAVTWSVLSQGASHRAGRFNGRLEHALITRSTCQPTMADSLYLREVLDRTMWSKHALGLGMTYRRFWEGITGSDQVTELIGYRKGSETWGNLISFRQLLPTARAKAAATTTAAPNPFTQELTISFELTRPQAVALELRDALGRVVLARPATLMAAGAGQLPLAIASLAPGLYTLWLKPAQEPAQVLKVVKAH